MSEAVETCQYCHSMQLRVAGLERTIEAAKLELMRLGHKMSDEEEFTTSDVDAVDRMIKWLDNSINPVA